jgi:hypothetical protein
MATKKGRNEAATTPVRKSSMDKTYLGAADAVTAPALRQPHPLLELEAKMAAAVTEVEQTRATSGEKKESEKLRRKEMSNQTKSEMVRIQFDFSREALSSLDQLVKDLNVKTRAEVIRRALEVYIDMLEAKSKKAKVFIEEPDGTRTRILGL